jgi:multiple sugar transport system permease protein
MRMTDRRFATLLMAPAALYLLLFVGYPVIRLVVDSLYDVRLLKPDERVFIGLQNYADALTSARIQGAAVRPFL